MFVYDFKFDDLSVIVYNTSLKNKHRYKTGTNFYVIIFDTDASKSVCTILLGLSRITTQLFLTMIKGFYVTFDLPCNSHRTKHPSSN